MSAAAVGVSDPAPLAPPEDDETAAVLRALMGSSKVAEVRRRTTFAAGRRAYLTVATQAGATAYTDALALMETDPAAAQALLEQAIEFQRRTKGDHDAATLGSLAALAGAVPGAGAGACFVCA